MINSVDICTAFAFAKISWFWHGTAATLAANFFSLFFGYFELLATQQAFNTIMSKAKKVKDIKDFTAVRWWWKADDKWIKYNDEVNLSLETDYQNGLKKIKVDDERFVDVSLTVSLNLIIYCIYFLIFAFTNAGGTT